jgi:toxin ParE1/3/4
MANYLLTNKAVMDLSNIWNFTFETWSEKQGDKYYTMLLDTCTELADKPRLGKKYDEVFPNLLGYAAYQHIIFYTVTSEKEIEIVRILHSRMNLKSRLNV